MRLQPLTVIFAGLFLASLGFNLLFLQRIRELDNRPARIILERPQKEIHIKPKVWGYTKERASKGIDR
jgi:hypothetical protein